MDTGLATNLDDLLRRRAIESSRVEFKATWDDHTKQATVRSVCAFANDFLNLNGGYVVIGVEEEGGQPVLPPRGLPEADVDLIQRELAGACKGSISPEYLPHLYPSSIEGKTILVVWAPAGENRPYEALKRDRSGRAYWVRSGSVTMEAQGDLRRQLLEQAAKIPFDDRRSLTGSIEDVSIAEVKRFLVDIRSRLASIDLDAGELLRRLRLVVPVNDHEVPRNVSLLFFSGEPERFFAGARIEVVEFGDDAGGDLIEEKAFVGSLPDQIRSCLRYLDGLGGSLLEKVRGQAEVERAVPYPYEAMEEAIVNAVYHRSYESPPEPTKVYLYPDRMEIISYPGPVPGISPQHFVEGRIPPVPARNRRIGDLLKDLRLAEGRGTGIPKIQRKMQENGSPEARFEFDEERSYFRVILPVHPRYQVIHALREAGHLWATGEKAKAAAHLRRAYDVQPTSGALAGQIIEYSFAQEQPEVAAEVLDHFEAQTSTTEQSIPFLAMARALIDRNQIREGQAVLSRVPPSRSANDSLELAILKKRTGDMQEAHRLFSEVYSSLPDDPKVVHEFAQTKVKLAVKLWRKSDLPVKRRLNREAAELLRKAIQLSDHRTREAWCWLDLAKTLEWLREPESEVETAYRKALSLLPEERIFQEQYDRWQDLSRSRRSP